MNKEHGLTKHGHCRVGEKTKTYNAWHCIKQRCGNPKNTSYPRYGGRGITLCDRWHSFDSFLEDVGEIPIGKTLDRIDNNKGYEPGNVRFATAEEQSNNRRSNRLIEYKEKSQTAAQWAKEIGIPYKTFHYRLQNGWTLEEAFETPKTEQTKLTHDGKAMWLSEWAEETGIPEPTLRSRRQRGCTPEEILSKEKGPLEMRRASSIHSLRLH